MLENDAYIRNDNSKIERSFGDKDCLDFLIWMEVKNFFIEKGGPKNDLYSLDRNGDGVACESLK